jgi:MFS family permease
MPEKNKDIVKFGLLTSLYWFSLYTYVPTLSAYAQSMGASNRLIGMIIAAYGFTQMIIRIPLGIASDKLNSRKLFVVAGIILSTISSMGMWWLQGPGWLLLFRAMAGAAASSWVAFTILFTGYFEHDRAPKAMGIINAYNSAGQLAAMLTGGVAVYFFSERAAFALAFGGGCIGLILCSQIKEVKTEGREPLRLRELSGLLSNFDYVTCSILSIISQFIAFSTVFGFTPLIAKQLGASPFELNMLSAVSTLPGILASALSGAYFAERLGERNTIAAGFLITAFSSACIPFVGSMGLLYVTQFVGGFGSGMTFSLLMGLSIKTVESRKRASAMGFFQAAYGIGMTFGPAILGVIGDTIGFTWGFMLIGALSALGAAVSFFARSGLQLKEM